METTTATNKLHAGQEGDLDVQAGQHCGRPWWARDTSRDRISPGTSWVMSGKLLSLSEPQFSHLQNGNNIYFCTLS